MMQWIKIAALSAVLALRGGDVRQQWPSRRHSAQGFRRTPTRHQRRLLFSGLAVHPDRLPEPGWRGSCTTSGPHHYDRDSGGQEHFGAGAGTGRDGRGAFGVVMPVAMAGWLFLH